MSGRAPPAETSPERRLTRIAEGVTEFPQILSVSNESPTMRIRLRLSSDSKWTLGHFPDRPVLPGIVQVHWAVLVCRALCGMTGSPSEIKRLKFRRVIVPPEDLELTVRPTSTQDAHFSFIVNREQCSDGTLVFGAID